MPIYDNNGTTSTEIGKLYDNNGTTSYQIGKAYDNNGTTSSLIYTAGEYLYDRGKKPYTVTLGKYTAGATLTSTRANEDPGTAIELYASGSTWGTGSPAGVKVTYSGIDLTNYSKLYVVATFKTMTVSGNSRFDIYVGNKVHEYGYILDTEAAAKLWVTAPTMNTEVTLELDISAATGSNYIIMRANVQTTAACTVFVHIHEIYLT